MSDQLLCGLALSAIGIAAIASGIPWLAVGFFAAAIPLLAVGTLLSFDRMRARQHQPAGPSR